MTASNINSGPKKSIIAAVGRSGTTVIHRLLLEIYVDHYGADFDVLYEPFVWDSKAVGLYPKDKAREAVFQTRDAVSDEGLFLHTQIPLFFQRDTLRPEIESLATSYLKGESQRPLLAKFIRANGRLALLDTLYPDGRFLVVLRNPLDVVNSVITMFSFYGAEFHKNDYPRFAADVGEVFGIDLPVERDLPPAYKAALWCHFMNLAAVKHASTRPNYRVVAYEDFAAHREAYTRLICEHLGVQHKPAYDAATAAPVGRVTKGAPVLGATEVSQMMGLFEEYLALVQRVPTLGPIDKDRILRKYADLPARGTYDARGLGWPPPRLEREIFTARRAVKDAAERQRFRIAEVQQNTFTIERPAAQDLPVAAVLFGSQDAQKSKAAIEALFCQTRPMSEVVVTGELADMAVPPGVRMLRHVPAVEAVRACTAPLVCFVDANDILHPTLIARQCAVLRGASDSVAFSDTFQTNTETYLDLSALAGAGPQQALARLLSRAVMAPRSVLASKDLMLSTGVSYDPWALCVRLAGKAKHWLYTGAAGTATGRPPGTAFSRLHAALSVLVGDLHEVVAPAENRHIAFAALINILGTDQALPKISFERTSQVPRAAIEAILAELPTLLQTFDAADATQEEAFLVELRRITAAAVSAIEAAT